MKLDPNFLENYRGYVIDYSPEHPGYRVLNAKGEIVAEIESYDGAMRWIEDRNRRDMVAE
ncbi:MAG TPA: hypothetical protein VGH47_02080 [Xanthobacteraceae bacterium]|jgi:hypothetical protein